MTAGLTPKQAQALMFLRTYVADQGCPPTFEEIRAALNLHGKSGVARLISALEERGYIRKLRCRARAIELIDTDPLRTAATSALIAELHRRGVDVPCPDHPGSEAGDGAAGHPSHSDHSPRHLNSVVHADGYAFSEQPYHG